jgi:hypothetical protein
VAKTNQQLIADADAGAGAGATSSDAITQTKEIIYVVCQDVGLQRAPECSRAWAYDCCCYHWAPSTLQTNAESMMLRNSTQTLTVQ